MKANKVVSKMINREIESPYINDDNSAMYIDMRITGTGLTDRPITEGYDESGHKIYKKDIEGNLLTQKYLRPFETFTSPEFLDACYNLPVLIRHSEGNENIKPITIGKILKPYIKGQEVWGIAKITDPIFFELLNEGIDSTSPAVVSSAKNINGIMVEEYNDKNDIKEVAIVPKGHWDNVSSEPAINISNDIKDLLKGDKEMEPKLELKKDADVSSEADVMTSILAKLDALQSQLDLLTKVEKEEGHPELQDNKDTDIPPAENKEADVPPVGKQEAKKDADVDKRKEIDEIGGILKGKNLDDETIRTVIGLAEKASYNPSTVSTKDDNELPPEPIKKDADMGGNAEIMALQESVKNLSDMVIQLKQKIEGDSDVNVNADEEEKIEEQYDALVRLSKEVDKNIELNIPDPKKAKSMGEYLQKVVSRNAKHLSSKFSKLAERCKSLKVDNSELELVSDAMVDIMTNVKKVVDEKRDHTKPYTVNGKTYYPKGIRGMSNI